MQTPPPKFSFLFIFGVILTFPALAQTPAKTPAESFEKLQKRLCTQQNPTLAKTYDFREYPPEMRDKGGKGTKRWYSFLGVIIPSLAKSSENKYPINSVDVLLNKWGLETPLGESKRSYQIRMDGKKKLEDLRVQGEQKWEEWSKQNPNARAEAKSKAELEIRYQGLGAAKLPKFDWREQGLEVGEVGNQGWNANLCWGFASVDAMQSSRRLSAMRNGRKDFNDTVRPNVRQLVSCMYSDKGTDYNRIMPALGAPFTYIFDNGLPLGGFSKYEKEKFDWECDPQARVKPLTWDYVSSQPHEIAGTEEIKEALIVYGPIMTAMNMDLCLPTYGGGVFNEQENSKATDQTFHVVLIIGWDDTKEGGAWLIKNSYGAEWGEKGFGWIKYGSNNVGRWASFIVADPKEEERIAKELNQEGSK